MRLIISISIIFTLFLTTYLIQDIAYASHPCMAGQPCDNMHDIPPNLNSVCDAVGEQCCDAGQTGSIPPHVFGRCKNGLVCNTHTLTCQSGVATVRATAAPRPSITCDKSTGDSDCNRTIDLADFEIWRAAYIDTIIIHNVDFNGDSKTNLSDFEIWRKGFFGVSQEKSKSFSNTCQDGTTIRKFVKNCAENPVCDKLGSYGDRFCRLPDGTCKLFCDGK